MKTCHFLRFSICEKSFYASTGSTSDPGYEAMALKAAKQRVQNTDNLVAQLTARLKCLSKEAAKVKARVSRLLADAQYRQAKQFLAAFKDAKAAWAKKPKAGQHCPGNQRDA